MEMQETLDGGKNMIILEALQTESGLRLSIGRRWLTAENGITFEVRTGGLHSEVI